MRYKKTVKDLLVKEMLSIVGFSETSREYIIDLKDRFDEFFTVTINKLYRYICCECEVCSNTWIKIKVCSHSSSIVFLFGDIFPEKFFKNKIISQKQLETVVKRIITLYDEKEVLRNFKKNYIEKDLTDKSCFICFSDFTIRPEHKIRDMSNIVQCFYCKNLLHTSCLVKWLDIDDSCIFCRYTWKCIKN